jgi:hypothetical protein
MTTSSSDLFTIPQGMPPDEAVSLLEEFCKQHGSMTQQELVDAKKSEATAKTLEKCRAIFEDAGVPVPADEPLLKIVTAIAAQSRLKNS